MQYLCPCIDELKFKDYQVYEAYRSGIGRRLFEKYGFFPSILCRKQRIILLALLSDGLAGRQATVKYVRNFLRPWKFHKEMSQTKGIILASRISIFMRWYHLMEEQVQQRFTLLWLVGKFKQLLLSHAYEKAAREAPILNRLFLQEWDYAQALRATRCSDFKEGSKPTAQLFGMMMASCTDDDDTMYCLQHMGQEIGYMLYLMSSVQTYRRDARRDSYNIYLERETPYPEAVENAQRQCYQAVAEMVRAYHTLMFLLHRDLIENILIDGLEQDITVMGSSAEESV